MVNKFVVIYEKQSHEETIKTKLFVYIYINTYLRALFGVAGQ